MKKKISLLLSLIIGFLVLSSNVNFDSEDIGASSATAFFEINAASFVDNSDKLLEAVQNISSDSASTVKARIALKNCRLSYKRIAFFTSYFFPSETAMYNSAPKFEVEEPELELVEPMGLQQIEALLYEDNVLSKKDELLVQAEAFYSSVKDLKTLLYQFKASDQQVLESLRIELIRVIALYISGYDAPLLKTGVTEALESLRSTEAILKPYYSHGEKEGKLLSETLKQSVVYLQSNQDFDSFDRMEFLVSYALPLQQQLGQFVETLSLDLNTSPYLNNKAANLFSRNFLNPFDSIPSQQKLEMALVGKKMFFDPGLSGNGKVSCATCHNPENYFSDGKIRSASIIKDSLIKRNTPSLIYSSFQHTQFWDGRSKTMTAQIKDVLFSPLEMGGNANAITVHLKNSKEYAQLFDTLQNEKSVVYIDRAAQAISAYLSGLNPLNSPFDQYIAGNKKAMNATQVKGFNLFMGKAQCGTCHFVPYFNSLTPPLYDRSEVEVLGTTKNDDFNHPEADPDNGRFDLFKIQYYQQAFKTPTVRNTEKTGPYMHNGNFKTLENVIEFYNKGGAIGLGIKTPDQTLSSRPLNLSPAESLAILQFIHSLSDTNTKQTHENN